MKAKLKLCFLLVCICMLVVAAGTVAFAAGGNTNVSMTVSASEVNVGDTVTVVINNQEMATAGVGVMLIFDPEYLVCTNITATDDDEYFGLYYSGKKGAATWVDADLANSVADTNSDGIFSFAVISVSDKTYFEGKIATLTFTAIKAGNVSITLEEQSSGTDGFKGVAATQTLTIKEAAPAHTCSENLTHHEAVASTCTVAGNSEYWSCECGKFYSDANATTEIAENSWVLGLNADNHKNTYTADGFHPDSSDSAYHYQWLACSDCTNKTIEKVNRVKHDDQMGDRDHNCDACGQENITVCTPEEDDGDCTTAIHCTECNAVTTPAKEAHVAGEDDHNCTTAVKCVYCDKNAVEAKTHVDGNDKNHVCDNAGCTVDNITAHTPATDDGDCTTAIHCTECNAVTTPAKEAHVAGEDDHNCTTAVKCVNCDKNAVEAKTHVDGDDNNHVCDNVGCTVDNVDGGHHGGTATCQAAAVCDECGQSYGEKDASNHTSTEVTYDNKKATTHDVHYACCGALKEAGVKHTGGAATCTEKAVCEHCKTAYGELKAHAGTYGFLYSMSDNVVTAYIRFTCSACQQTFDTASISETRIYTEGNCQQESKSECTLNFLNIALPAGCTWDNFTFDGYLYNDKSLTWDAEAKTLTQVFNWGKNYNKHTSNEVTYKNVTATTHDEYHKCCDTLKKAEVSHDFDNADHKCVCGKVETFTFTWIKENGDVVYTETVEYGKDALNIPALPYEKPGYTASWSHNGKGITENTTITMVFTENTYRVEVYSANGKTLLETRQHKYKTWISTNVTNFNGIPGTGTSLEGHGFVGFSLEPNGEKVCSTTIYRISVITDNAVYDAERGVYIVKLYVVIGPLQYSISYWVDGKIYSSDRYEYGAAIIPETRIPHKAQDGCSVYTFAGWDKEIPATMPAGNVEIHATFTETKNHTGKPVYTDNKNGTHSAAYNCCNAPYVTNEAHDYVTPNHEDKTYDCVCGAQEEIKLPEVVVTDIKNSLTSNDPNLTFALNFAIKDLANLDEEYLAKVLEIYGNYYTDYVLTISGLTKESVIFNANGNADGYLAGQYDAWSENWVTVPFENVTVKNEESLYIMEYAAKLMGKQGLRFTLAEIAMIVQNFDCGVYFTPEFLAANPNLKVTLELKVFTEDAQGNKVNDISVAKNDFNNNVVSGWNNIDGDWYYVSEGKLATGITRVPYPTVAINGVTYAPNASDKAYWEAHKDTSKYSDATTAVFYFDADGKFVQYDGIEGKSYFIDGMAPWHVGFVKVDNDYYYFSSDKVNGGNVMATGKVYATRDHNAGKPIGGTCIYFFEQDGKLMKNDGVAVIDGVPYYFDTDNKLALGKGLVSLGEGFVYVRSGGQLAIGTYYSGIYKYEFDASGYTTGVKNGIVDGKYYENGHVKYGAGVVKLEDEEGKTFYIYVKSNGKLATGKYWPTTRNGYLEKGEYDWGMDGKYYPPTEVLNGIVADGDNLYYYVNGKKQVGLGVVELADEKGETFYIYVKSNGKLATGKYWPTTGVITEENPDGLLPRGEYDWGTDGKYYPAK